MFSVDEPPLRSAAFAVRSACVFGVMVYQAALTVQSMPTCRNWNAVAAAVADVSPAYDSFSTAVWLPISRVQRVFSALLSTWSLMTWYQVSTVTDPVARAAARFGLPSFVTWSADRELGSLAAVPALARAAPAAAGEKQAAEAAVEAAGAVRPSGTSANASAASDVRRD